jgi:acyl-CoA synthetase (AMP-forming)/AMP-acid ligase II
MRAISPGHPIRPPLEGDFETLGEAFVAAGRQFPGREAYVEGTDRLTFSAWLRRAESVAAVMRARRVRAGDVVALMLPPSIDYAVAFGAVTLLGAVATGLNTRLGPIEVGAILDRAAPSLVVRDEELGLPPVPEALSLIARRHLIEVGDTGAATPPGQEFVSRHDPAVIIWTSGTTGVPKGAWFDHDSLRAAVKTAGVMSAPFDRRLVATPFAHAGYMAKLWEQLAWGTTVVVGPQPWNAADTVRLMADERITVAGGVPTQWAKVVERPELERADLSSLRLCVSATAPAPPELVERVVKRLGCPMVVRYAMTESPSISGTDPVDPPDVLYRSVGRPQAGVEVELRDDKGDATSAGAVARIHVRSTCAMRGYWQDPELTSAAFDDQGWLRSGDLGHFDADGNLVLDGRADDMYIRGGYNVYPLEVEHVLDEHPGVAQASVIGVAAPVIGQIGVAFVQPADPARPPSTADLVSWCRDRLADYKAPDRVVVVDELPLTSMLKVDKATLRTRAGTPGAA